MQLPYLPGLLLPAAHGRASACRFKSYCCSGPGASLFPLPFRQAWSQPGIKLFKSSRRAPQLKRNPQGRSPRGKPPARHKACWFSPFPEVKGPSV